MNARTFASVLVRILGLWFLVVVVNASLLLAYRLLKNKDTHIVELPGSCSSTCAAIGIGAGLGILLIVLGKHIGRWLARDLNDD